MEGGIQVKTSVLESETDNKSFQLTWAKQCFSIKLFSKATQKQKCARMVFEVALKNVKLKF